MALIEILSADLKARLEIARLLQALGHQPVHAADMKDFADLQAQAPEVLVAVEPSDDWVAQVRRASPTLPLVVCLNERSAPRALEYLKLGAADCVAPPFTREALGACVRKALRLSGTVLELSELPPPPKRKAAKLRGRVLFTAGFLLIAGGALLARWLAPPPPERTVVHDLPYLHPAGVAATADAYWVGEWYSQSIYEHDRATLAVRRVRSFPSEPPSALAMAEGALWVISADGRLTKHLLDPKLTVLARYRLPGRNIIGLCYDGLYLWSADRQEKKLRQHLLDDRLNVVKEFPYPNGVPAAIACDRRSLWSIEETRGELVRHDLADPAAALERAALESFGPGAWKSAGLAVSDGRLIIVAEAAGGGRAVLAVLKR